MGCCVSTGNTETAAKKPHLNYNKNTSGGASPPAANPFLEEETVVKEVLSETPSLPKPDISRFTENDQPTKKGTPLSPYEAATLPELRDEKQQHHHQRNDGVFKKPGMVFATSDEFSEDASEICSSTLSESVSTATEKMDMINRGYYYDDASKIRPRSPAKYRNSQLSGERTAVKSPARRSPGRAGSTPGRDGIANGQNSDRRSRSPVTRVGGSSGPRAGLGRCPSGRGLGKSPGRVGSELGGRIQRVGQDGGDRENKSPPTSSNESFENPLVSLECFIFL